MSVVPINQEPEAHVELVDDLLRAREISFGGAIVEVARDLELEDDPALLTRLLTDAVEVGATVLRNGQSPALVESLALEIDRLVSTTSDETERLPEALQKPLAEHLQKLSDLLAEHFDPKQAR